MGDGGTGLELIEDRIEGKGEKGNSPARARD